MNKSITLIGMAGAWKSTIGKQLAKLLDFNFLDGDLIIEERINQSLQNFLDQHGGKEFTKIEEEVLLSINFDKTILATGGSAVLSDSAMQFLRKESEIIYRVGICFLVAILSRIDPSRQVSMDAARSSS